MIELNSELFPMPIRALLKSLGQIGFFDDSLLIGSWVMPVYDELYGVRYHLRTGDIDFAVQLAHPRKNLRADLAKAITDLGFLDFMDNEIQKFTSSGYEVEFIVHRAGGRDPGFIPVPEWNLQALPLPFIDLLLNFSDTALLDGTPIRFPVPEAFFVHKLIISQRRKLKSKAEKDLEQCAVLQQTLDLDVLTRVLGFRPLGKDTRVKLVRACEAISFPLQNLNI